MVSRCRRSLLGITLCNARRSTTVATLKVGAAVGRTVIINRPTIYTRSTPIPSFIMAKSKVYISVINWFANGGGLTSTLL
jgi:hypothetical protein